MSDRGAQARRVAALAALICLGTCAVLRSRKPPPLPAPPAINAKSATGTAPETRTEPSGVRSLTAPAAPVIDSITVEKDEVCEGEENLVTVKAHTTDGNDAFLHYQVGATRGSPVALRSYLDDRDRPTAHRVSVFGKSNVATSLEVPAFRVKRCDVALAVVIQHRLRPNSFAELDFEARIVSTSALRSENAPDANFRPRGFAWSFGDGASESGPESHATHDFAARAQDTLYSHFLVTVEVLGEDGRKVTGRHAIELLNPAFEAFAYKGVVVLFADLDPRFPVLSANGVVDQGVRLWHTRPGVVMITKVSVTTRRLDRGPSAPAAYPPVAAVLGRAEIPPGRGLELHVALDTNAEPETIGRDYVLEGRSYDGRPVRGAFSVMKPPPLPTREKHEPIGDPILLAKVKMAREVLHREFVTDDDLETLERAGRFHDLKVDAGAPATK